MSDYVLSVRRVDKDGKFENEPGKSRYLRVPGNRLPKVRYEIEKADWVQHVLKEAQTGTDENGDPVGDVLFYVHGYNNSTDVVMRRHRQLKENLEAVGYQGAVVSFDWPSDQKAINYLEDRTDAKISSLQLVTDGIMLLSKAQSKGCRINVHVLAHSMGAYVVREAFDDADDRPAVASVAWTASQVCLAGADISSRSMAAGSSKTSSLYRRSVRITNYYSRFDSVLKLSNVKRVGVARRLGRVGLPDVTSSKSVDIDCSNYFATLDEDANDFIGSFSHSWYIGDMTFIRDLFYTIQGDIDRNAIPTRDVRVENRLELKALAV
jgi:esterase/lipase superfamily enzyme